MSLRPSTVLSPTVCSGLMYDGVPTTMPVCVSATSPARLAARAMPNGRLVEGNAVPHRCDLFGRLRGNPRFEEPLGRIKTAWGQMQRLV